MENLLSKPEVAVISKNQLWELAFSTIKELEFEEGIRASGEEDRFGCVFGRDSLITSLKLLNAYRKNRDPYLLFLVKKILSKLSLLQGREENIESGEEAGKCIHECRAGKYNMDNFGWYVYPDGILRNYDSVDSTPLFLIAAYRYWQVSNDSVFLLTHLPNILAGLDWILKRGDSNQDGFIDYKIQTRLSGGLTVQSWMDSTESLFDESGEAPCFPIATIEVQAYSYLALKLWGKYLSDEKLISRAENLKNLFNKKFVIESSGKLIFPYAIDGNGKPLLSLRSSIGHCLWASLNPELDQEEDSILEKEYAPEIARQLFLPELFVEAAGIRTLSSGSSRFEVDSYHNGSIWPHDNSMIAEGLEIFGYKNEAIKIKDAIFNSIHHFGSAIELYTYDGEFGEYSGGASRRQAWCAASLLSDLASCGNF
ncbi:hypothetical protein HYT00_03195 [Candidatus Giovannonibacteria bacterium]|nr:hypothetical protein [Candidatus Giovannonibacteria bacterium]